MTDREELMRALRSVAEDSADWTGELLRKAAAMLEADGAKQEPVLRDTLIKSIETAIVEHCQGGDLWTCAMLAAKRIERLYAAPVAQQPLTDEECDGLLRRVGICANYETIREIIRATEQAHGIGGKHD